MDHEPGTADTDPADATEDGAATGEAQDTKARFRAALDRKQQNARRSTEGRPNTGSVHGSEVVGGGPKRFRRKSG